MFSKLLNNLHLNILANFSEITKNLEEIKKDLKLEDYNTIITEIFSDLSSFYRIKKNNKKKVDDFILAKSNEIDIHEIITRIFNNLTKDEGLCQIILKDPCVFDDILNFLNKLNGNFKMKEKEFVKFILEKKKKSNDDPKKTISNIMECSLTAVKNILTIGPNFQEFLKFKANVYNYLKLDRN